MEPDFHRSLGQAEHARNRRLRQVVPVAKVDQSAFLECEPGESLLDRNFTYKLILAEQVGANSLRCSASCKVGLLPLACPEP
jgi:hypothetical protein